MATIDAVRTYIEERIKELNKEKVDLQYYMGHNNDYVYVAKIHELRKVLDNLDEV
jgi:hypothetical protein